MLREDFIQLMFGYFSGSSKTLFDLSVGSKPENITPIQYNILEYLYFTDYKNLSDISQCMYLSMPNASREVKKLVEKKLLTSKNDPDDKRKHYFYTTENGRDVMNQAFQIVVKNANQKYDHLSEKKQKELMQHMKVIMDQLFV